MRNNALAIIALSLILSLSGCGYNPVTRAVTGGVIGAGTGAFVGGVTTGNPAAGALIGGGVGAVGGVLTAP